MRKRLFIPGPTEVHPEVLAASATPPIGHRSAEFVALYERIAGRLQQVFCTRGPVLTLSTSATGAMEAAVVSLARRRVLSLVCGAFSKRWHDIAVAAGLEADVLEVEWGRAHTAESLREALAGSDYDTVTVVHSETSTGVLNPIADLARVVREAEDVLLLVDAVSSLGGARLEFDEWGLDLCLCGLQKALAMPPGLALVALSERARARLAQTRARSFYLDLSKILANHEKRQTATTPPIALYFALEVGLARILDEGLEARWERHQAMADRCRAWASGRFALFAEASHMTPTLTAIRNTRRIQVGALNEHLAARGAVISNGYGRLKEHTFRIAHMGEIQPADLDELLGWIDEFVSAAPGSSCP